LSCAHAATCVNSRALYRLRKTQRGPIPAHGVRQGLQSVPLMTRTKLQRKSERISSDRRLATPEEIAYFALAFMRARKW
jgi:hypothetical protein